MDYAQMITKGLDNIEGTLQKHADKQRELADEILQLKQRGTASRDEGTGATGPGIASQVMKQLAEGGQELLGKTKRVRFEVKAASDVVTTASGRKIIAGGVGAPTAANLLGVQNGMTVVSTPSTSAVEYFRFTGTEGEAGVQAGEGAAKSAVRPTHSAITQTALTIAGWTKVSRQALNDSTELKQAIDTVLMREVNKSLDAMLINGSLTPSFTGLGTLATASTSTNYTILADAVSEAVASMQEAGFMPDVVALSPADWLRVQTLQTGAGDYYSGVYLGALPSSLRGLRVVVSPNVPAGKAMVMDSSQIELRVVDTFAVEAAYDGDDFTRNQMTLLGELRVIPVYRSVGAARLITPKAA